MNIHLDAMEAQIQVLVKHCLVERRVMCRFLKFRKALEYEIRTLTNAVHTLLVAENDNSYIYSPAELQRRRDLVDLALQPFNTPEPEEETEVVEDASWNPGY